MPLAHRRARSVTTRAPTSSTRSFALMLSLGAAVVLALPAAAYQLSGAAWDVDKGPVLYHLEPSGSDDIEDGSDLDAVRDAFRRWSCVPGQRLRFAEAADEGVPQVALDDGRNSVFWDETGEFGLGPATLGVTVGTAGDDPSQPVVRDAADIVFNGVDHEWSTTDDIGQLGERVDVASIAIHETGHWLGLNHPCTDSSETDCLGPDVAVMHPIYPGGFLREPLSDDVAAIRALYPSTDTSTCEGPYRQGEVCTCNDECIAGLACTEAQDGAQICAPSCSSEDTTCPAGFACVLGPRIEGGAAGGACLKLAAAGLKPVGATCDNDRECEAGLCALAEPVGRTICRVRCEVGEECVPGTLCTDGVCLPRTSAGIECQVAPEPGCSCASSARATSHEAPGALIAPLLLLGLWGRRRAASPAAIR